jgi:imidazolonepropionase-like amidohydrolase
MLRIEDRTGTLKAGMEADMILVDGKPDQDIHALSNITMVVTDGLGIDGDVLAQKFKGRVGR